MRERYPSELAERVQVRLPDGLRDRLKAAADLNGRSMNNEISMRLLASFQTVNPHLHEAVDLMRPDVEAAVERMIESAIESRLRKIGATIGSQP